MKIKIIIKRKVERTLSNHKTINFNVEFLRKKILDRLNHPINLYTIFERDIITESNITNDSNIFQEKVVILPESEIGDNFVKLNLADLDIILEWFSSKTISFEKFKKDKFYFKIRFIKKNFQNKDETYFICFEKTYGINKYTLKINSRRWVLNNKYKVICISK